MQTHQTQTTPGLYLREQTQSLHRQLDHLPRLQQLATGHFSRIQYIECLQRFYSVYSVLEQGLLEMECDLNLHADLVYQTRVPVLALELSSLGAELPKQSGRFIYSPPVCAAYWGARYVLEGSCLGAKVLTPRIQAGLGLANDQPLYFFRHLSSLSARWPGYLLALNQYLCSQYDQHHAVNTARQVFRLFHSHFSDVE